MYGIKDFKSNRNDIDFYFVDLSQTKYKREDLVSAFPTFTEFMKRFNVGVKELCELFDKYGVNDKDLFEYTIIKNDFIVCEDGVFTEKWKTNGYGYTKLERVFYNVYVRANQYVSLILNKVAKDLVIKNFPFLISEPFVRMTKRFTDDINRLPKTLNAEIDSIENNILFNNKLTIGDLIKLYTDEAYKDSYVAKPIWTVYSDGSIYINTDEDRSGYSLCTTFNELKNGDWKAIENHEVFSICLYDDNGKLVKGKWYEGLQKDAPYFNHPVVRELKKWCTSWLYS